MITDIVTVLWKEWKEILAQYKNFDFKLIIRLIGLIFINWIFISQAGDDWFSAPLVIITSFLIPLLTVADIVADTFAGEKERHTLATLLATRLSDLAILTGKVLSTSIYGWVHVILMLIFGLIIGNIFTGGTPIDFYSTPILLGSLLVGLLTSAAASFTGVILSLKAATVKIAQQNLGSAFMILSLSSIILVRSMPINLWSIPANFPFWFLILTAVLLLLLINGILFLIAKRHFRRERLILN